VLSPTRSKGLKPSKRVATPDVASRARLGFDPRARRPCRAADVKLLEPRYLAPSLCRAVLRSPQWSRPASSARSTREWSARRRRSLRRARSARPRLLCAPPRRASDHSNLSARDSPTPRELPRDPGKGQAVVGGYEPPYDLGQSSEHSRIMMIYRGLRFALSDLGVRNLRWASKRHSSESVEALQ
jgi:hypothetical protein